MISQSRLLQRGLTPTSSPGSILHPHPCGVFFPFPPAPSQITCHRYTTAPSFKRRQVFPQTEGEANLLAPLPFVSERLAAPAVTGAQDGQVSAPPHNRIASEERVDALPALCRIH